MMALLSQVEWRNIAWLLLALQPLAIWLLRRLRRSRVRHYAEAPLLPWALAGGTASRGRWRRAANWLAWLLLAAAAAGPRLPLLPTGGAPLAVLHDIDLMLVLDVSPSMLARDVSPQRLERAKLKLDDLARRLHGERIGLIAFSAVPALVMPLNSDYRTLAYYLPYVDTALFAAPGSNIAAALELARRNLPVDSRRSRAVVLLTDGDVSALSGQQGAAALASAQALKAAGIPLFILGMGTEQGGTIPLPGGGEIEENGAPVVSRMDAAGFRELARAAGGRFAAVADGDSDWNALYDGGILALPGGGQRRPPALAWHELYAWLLFPALLLFLVPLLPGRGGMGKALALILAGLAGLTALDAPPAQAGDNTASGAYAAYRSHNYVQAQSLYGQLPGYAARMGEGAAAYRRKDYSHAAGQFSAALLAAANPPQRADALFNLGNCYFSRRQLKEAAEAYRGVLRYRPGDRPASANLALASAKLASLAKLDPYSEGIVRRRAEPSIDQTGDADGAAAPLPRDPREGGPMIAQQAGADGRAQPRFQFAPARDSQRVADPEAVYRAALKKLDLVTDKAAPLYKEMAKLDAAGFDAPAEASPW